MKLQNLSVRVFLRKIVAGTLLTAALLLLIFFLLTKDVRVVICGIILTAAFSSRLTADPLIAHAVSCLNIFPLVCFDFFTDTALF